MKTSNENSRSETASTLTKLRVSAAVNSGSSSSSSALATAAYWPSRSQPSQKPPIALIYTNTSRGTPVNQLARRKPRSTDDPTSAPQSLLRTSYSALCLTNIITQQ